MKGKIVLLIIVTILITSLVVCSIYKPSVHEATYDQIMSIKGIGDTLTTRVLSYLTQNPECTLEDLDDVLGIGEEKLKLLSKEWK